MVLIDQKMHAWRIILPGIFYVSLVKKLIEDDQLPANTGKHPGGGQAGT